MRKPVCLVWLMLLIALVMGVVLGACAAPTFAPTMAPPTGAPAAQATKAPAPTQVPAAQATKVPAPTQAPAAFLPTRCSTDCRGSCTVPTLGKSGTCYQFNNASGVVLFVPEGLSQQLTFKSLPVSSAVPTWLWDKGLYCVSNRFALTVEGPGQKSVGDFANNPIYIQVPYTEAEVKQLYCRKSLKQRSCTDDDIKKTYDQNCTKDPQACTDRLRLYMYDDSSRKWSMLQSYKVDRSTMTIMAAIKTTIPDRDPVCMGYD